MQAALPLVLQDAVRGDFNDLAKLLIDRGALLYDANQVCMLQHALIPLPPFAR